MITFKELKENEILGHYISNSALKYDDNTCDYILQSGYKNCFRLNGSMIYSVMQSIEYEDRAYYDHDKYSILDVPNSATAKEILKFYNEFIKLMNIGTMIYGLSNECHALAYHPESIRKRIMERYSDASVLPNFYLTNNRNMVAKYLANRHILKSLGCEVNWYDVPALHSFKDITLFTLEYKKHKREIYDVWTGQGFLSRKSSKNMFSCLEFYDNNIVFVVDLTAYKDQNAPNFFYGRIGNKNSYAELLSKIEEDKKYLVIMFNYDLFEKIYSALQYNMNGIKTTLEKRGSIDVFEISIPALCRRLTSEIYNKELIARKLFVEKEML